MKVRRPEGDRIRSRYAHLLAGEPAAARPAELVEVGSIDELVRLAERCGAGIDWSCGGDGREQFTVDDGDLRYRYRTRAGTRPSGVRTV